ERRGERVGAGATDRDRHVADVDVGGGVGVVGRVQRRGGGEADVAAVGADRSVGRVVAGGAPGGAVQVGTAAGDELDDAGGEALADHAADARERGLEGEVAAIGGDRG